MNKKLLFGSAALILSFYLGVSYGQGSHAQTAINLLNQALKEAVQCGGGGATGAGCKGPRAESINYIKLAISKMNESMK